MMLSFWNNVAWNWSTHVYSGAAPVAGEGWDAPAVPLPADAAVAAVPAPATGWEEGSAPAPTGW
jgi:small subunit ribosomal protein SAe